jgi:hypothetical protein
MVYFLVSWGVLAVAGLLVAPIFGHHALKVALVAFGVMFLVSLVALFLYAFTLPPESGRGN